MNVTRARLIGLVLAAVSWPNAARASDVDDDLVVESKPAATTKATATPTKTDWLESVLSPLSVVAFMQTDMHGSAASEDEIQQGGALLNEDRFALKTARVRVDASWTYVHGQLEVEANTTKGPTIRPYHVFGGFHVPNPKDPNGPALAAASLGLFDTPFGYEGPESPRLRWFMDRTTASKAFFPGVPDLGLWVYGALGPFRWSFAAMNGEPLDTTYQGIAPVSAKQVVMHFGFDAHARDDLEISGGISSLRGRGFHPGATSGKNVITWNDINEDGAIQPAELVGQSATASAPSQLFDRWSIGADIQARLKTKLGMSTLSAEMTIGQNMDRGVYIADPVFLGLDTRELGAYAALTQEITKWAVLGFRFDYYDPNLDAFDKRAGTLIPSQQSIMTFSPLVGFVFPGVLGHGDRAYGKARLLFQYDFIRDHLARSTLGIPADLGNDAWTVRLQVEL